MPKLASSKLLFQGVRSTVHLDHLPGSFFGPSNLVDLLRHRALHQGHDRAFTYLADGETDEMNLSYQQLDERARAIAARLSGLGLEGERALLLYPAGLDFIVAFFGCCRPIRPAAIGRYRGSKRLSTMLRPRLP